MRYKGILLVEDNADDELMTLEALNMDLIGEVKVVRDGVEALDYLFSKGAYAKRSIMDLPAVVLLDLKLPKIDGLEVMNRIRADKHTCLLPVVLLTSSEDQEDRLKGYCLGANSYIRKPVESDEFKKAVRQLGLYWLLNEPPSN